VRIVRGTVGAVVPADLFCNGTPIARLRPKRIVELDLRPGWYRFSVKPDHPVVLCLARGRTYYFVTDSRSIVQADLDETNAATTALRRSPQRTLSELLAGSKPVDASDMYLPATCSPLREEIWEAKPPAPSNQ